MNIHLIVVRPFDCLNRGDTVTDTARIAHILGSEWVSSVVRVLSVPVKGN
jgi:hypothetical protein